MPKGKPGAERTNGITVWLSDEEKELWRASATEMGHTSVAPWVRRLVHERLSKPLNGDVPRRKPLIESDRKAYVHLAAVSNNMQQMARWCNYERRAPDEELFNRALSGVGMLTDRLLHVLVVTEPNPS